MQGRFLTATNAVLNALAAVCLVVGVARSAEGTWLSIPFSPRSPFNRTTRKT
jgi:uncharacterized membrane protein